MVRTSLCHNEQSSKVAESIISQSGATMPFAIRRNQMNTYRLAMLEARVYYTAKGDCNRDTKVIGDCWPCHPNLLRPAWLWLSHVCCMRVLRKAISRKPTLGALQQVLSCSDSAAACEQRRRAMTPASTVRPCCGDTTAAYRLPPQNLSQAWPGGRWSLLSGG